MTYYRPQGCKKWHTTYWPDQETDQRFWTKCGLEVNCYYETTTAPDPAEICQRCERRKEEQ